MSEAPSPSPNETAPADGAGEIDEEPPAKKQRGGKIDWASDEYNAPMYQPLAALFKVSALKDLTTPSASKNGARRRRTL